MKKHLLIALLVLQFSFISKVFSQSVSINTTGNAADTSAILDITSASKGILIPRMTQTQKLAIVTPADGLLIYQNDGTKGFYYYSTVSSTWTLLASSGQSIVSLNGLTATVQTFATPGTAGTTPAWSSSGSAHTLNIPLASATSVTAGLLSNADWTTFNNKQPAGSYLTTAVTSFGKTDNFGITSSVTNSTTTPVHAIGVDTSLIASRNRLTGDSSILAAAINAKGTGSVTSVATGYGLSGGTITASGTLVLDSATLFVTGLRKKDSTFYATVYQNSLKQPQLNGTGFVKATGTAISYDNSTYLTAIDTTNITSFSTKVRSLFSATAPVTYANGLIGITQATASANGYLSSADWTTFNNKASTTNSWSTTGNAGTTYATNFLGTTDNTSLRFRTNNIQQLLFDSLGNVAIGNGAAQTSGINIEKLLVDAGTTNSFNVISGKGSINSYLQLNIQNRSNGTAASSDVVASNDVATETTNFIDMGVNSSGNTSTGVLGGASTAYLYGTGNDFAIGNGATGKNLNFFTTGSSTSIERMRIDSTGKVGIGTTTPATALHVSATANPLTLNGVQTGTNTTADSLLTITSGLVRKLPLSTFASATNAISSLNGLTAAIQTFATPGTSGTAPAWSSSSSAHTLNIPLASASGVTAGLLSNTDWSTFNNKLSTIDTGNIANFYLKVRSLHTAGAGISYNSTTGVISNSGVTTVNGLTGAINFPTGNLTETGSSILTITGGTGAVFGTGAAIQVKQANTSQSGFLSSTDWNTFNNKASTTNSWSTTGNASAILGTNFLGTTDATSSLRFRTNNTQGMLLDSAGNVAIGSAPAQTAGTNIEKLLVDAGVTNSINVISGKGNINNYLQLNIQNKNGGTAASSDVVATADNGDENSNYVDMGINSSGNTANNFGGANDAYLYAQSQNMLIGTATANKSVVFLTGGSTQSTNERMRITGTGNVGIGTNAPASALHVVGTNPLTLNGVQTGSNTDSILTIVGGVVKKLSPSSLSVASSNAWALVGNNNTLASNYFLGTTNTDPLIFKINSGLAGRLDLVNTFLGYQSGVSNGSSAQSTGIGYQALHSNTSGTDNTAIGYNSLPNNATGSFNIGLGYNADVTGNSSNSIAIGTNSAISTSNSIAMGTSAQVQTNTNGMALGNYAYVTGQNGVAIGNSITSAKTQAVGTSSIALGYNAYSGGTNSIAIGTASSSNATNAVLIGAGATSSSSNATALGSNASVTAANSTALGYNAIATLADEIILGDRSNTNLSVGIGSEGFANSPNREKLLVDAGTTGSYNVISGKGTINNYLQLNIQNKSTGNGASSDIVATADNGDEVTNYVDLGINGSGNTSNNFGAANDAYLYAQTQNMLIGTASSAKSVVFLTGGGTQSTNERMRIDGSGNVGIGTNAPSTKLHIVGTNPLTLTGVQTGTNTTADSLLTISTGLVRKLPLSTFASPVNTWSTTGNAGTNIATNFLGTTDFKSVRFRTNNLQRMILDSIGNVAIGTDTFDVTNPEKFLINAGNTSSVNGLVTKGAINSYFQMNIKNLSSGANATSDIVATADNGTETTNYVDLGINGSGYSGSAIETGVANDGYLISSGNDFYMVNSSANKNMLFLTGGTGLTNERMRILPNGYIGLGVQNPTAELVVRDTMEIRRVGSLSQLLFTNTAGTGDLRIGGDGGDLYWQGGGSRNLQMGSYWTTILGGDRQTSAYPAFVSSVGGTGVLVQSQRDASVPLGIQANSSTQTSNLTEWRNSAGTAVSAVDKSGNLGLGVTAPTAALHLKAGTATANTAPLKLTSGTNLGSPETGAVEFDGTNYFATSGATRYTLAKTLTATATFDFPNTTAGSSNTNTITVAGAADGDVVILGVTNAANNASSNYTAYVSGTNTVVIKFNNYSAAAINPASGTFRVSVLRY